MAAAEVRGVDLAGEVEQGSLRRPRLDERARRLAHRPHDLAPQPLAIELGVGAGEVDRGHDLARSVPYRCADAGDAGLESGHAEGVAAWLG